MILFVKNVLFTLLMPATIAVYIPYLLTCAEAAVESVWTVILSTLFFATGALIYLWCVANFAIIGRGTPLPIDAPKKLIVVGPHRYVRNPMYLAVLSIIAGWAVLYYSIILLAYWFLFAVIFHLFILLVEEPSLRRQFNSEYESYTARVHRWIPRKPD